MFFYLFTIDFSDASCLHQAAFVRQVSTSHILYFLSNTAWRKCKSEYELSATRPITLLAQFYVLTP